LLAEGACDRPVTGELVAEFVVAPALIRERVGRVGVAMADEEA
jgi:hypothetical protein